MRSKEIVDGLMSKGTFYKEMPNIFNFALAEATPIRTIPSFSSKIVPSIYFIFNDQPYEAFYLLWDARAENVSCDRKEVNCKRQ